MPLNGYVFQDKLVTYSAPTLTHMKIGSLFRMIPKIFQIILNVYLILMNIFMNQDFVFLF